LVCCHHIFDLGVWSFIVVALVTQKKDSGIEKHGVIEYVPPEQDIILGEDLRGYTSPSGLKFS